MTSPAEALATRLVGELGPAAHRAIDIALAKLTVSERCHLQYNWRGFWSRPKQQIPHGPWNSYGFKTGRAFGKTRAVAEFVDEEARAGRAGRIALCAETEDKTVDVMIEGKSGLLAIARPWFRPRWEPGNGRLVYPNGAQAFVYYATEPEKFRGPEHHLFWGDEIGSWQENTGAECWSNMHMGLRLGYGKLVWSSTPRSTSLMRKLSERNKARPLEHIIVKGSTWENRGNLPKHIIEEWLEEYGGTRIGKRELEGEDLDDNPGALFTLTNIQANRRRAPDVFVRAVIAVDPARTSSKTADQTGIVVAGLGTDGQIFILRDLTGPPLERMAPEVWAKIVIDAYRRYGCDVIVYEGNTGPELLLRNIRAEDKTIPLDRFKCVIARRGKELRAEPVSTLYERGKVSHAAGVDLSELEKQMVEWDPSRSPSPDRVDAMVYAVLELAQIGPKDQWTDDYTSARLPPQARSTGSPLDDDDDDDRGGSRWR